MPNVKGSGCKLLRQNYWEFDLRLPPFLGGNQIMSQVAVKICQLSVLKIHGVQLLVTLVGT